MATVADAADVAILVLKGAQLAASLAAEAIQASREGDDAKALAKLDEAIAQFHAGASASSLALERVRSEFNHLINDKFDSTDAKPPGDEETPKV